MSDETTKLTFLEAEQDPDDNMITVHWKVDDETIWLVVYSSGKIMRLWSGRQPVEINVMDLAP